jgi:hypothetical protein
MQAISSLKIHIRWHKVLHVIKMTEVMCLREKTYRIYAT